MASGCGFPIRSAADRHLEELLVAVQTKRQVNLSRELTTADLADLRRTAELFREVVPLLRVELGKLRATLLGGAEAATILRVQTNPFLETVTDAPKKKKEVVKFAADQQINPFLADSRLEVETNPFARPAVQWNSAAAVATLPDRRSSVLKPVLAANTAAVADPKHSGASVQAVSVQVVSPEREKKVVTFAVDQQTNPFLAASQKQAMPVQAGSPEREKKVVTLAVDQQTNPFLAASQKEVETNSFARLAVRPIRADAMLPERNLPAAGATLPERPTSVVKTISEANIAAVTDPIHSGATVEAVSVQAGSPERKEKVITFAVNQQRPMAVQRASEAKAHQPRAPVKVDQHIILSSSTTDKTNPDITFQCPENKPQKSRQRPRTRRSSEFRPPVPHPKLDSASANQFIEKQVVVSLPPCYYCGGKHALCRCSDFFFLRLTEREDFVQRMKLCNNCFSQQHNASSCRDKARCLRCPQWHHTLLHRNV